MELLVVQPGQLLLAKHQVVCLEPSEVVEKLDRNTILEEFQVELQTD